MFNVQTCLKLSFLSPKLKHCLEEYFTIKKISKNDVIPITSLFFNLIIIFTHHHKKPFQRNLSMFSFFNELAICQIKKKASFTPIVSTAHDKWFQRLNKTQESIRQFSLEVWLQSARLYLFWKITQINERVLLQDFVYGHLLSRTFNPLHCRNEPKRKATRLTPAIG